MGPLGLLLLGLGISAASAEADRFERRAAEDISARLRGVDRQVNVKINPTLTWGKVKSASITASDFELDELPLYTDPEGSTRGSLDLLSLRLTDFRLGGLLIDELSTDIYGSRWDTRSIKTGELRLTRSGTGRGFVKISEEALAEWVVSKNPEIKRAVVEVDRDVIWVDGYGEFLFVKSEFTIIAKLATDDGTKLNLVDPKVYFDWNRASKPAAQALLNILNPVVDLNKDLNLHNAVKVDNFRLRGGSLLAEGQTVIPERPELKTGV
jgi:hypothetical protein